MGKRAAVTHGNALPDGGFDAVFVEKGDVVLQRSEIF
jgi:hypothetical protein